MLSDRPSLRWNYHRERTSATVWLVAVLVAAYVVQLPVANGWFAGGTDIAGALSLTIRSLQIGHWWTPLTHVLVQNTANPFPFFFTVLTIFLIGNELEPQIGARRLLAVCFGATLLGALAWTAAHYHQGGAHYGVSAALLGMFVVVACLYPNEEVSFLAFFVIPVTMRPRYFVYGLLVLDVVALIAFELPSGAVPLGLAPSAQLGGMLAGWLFFRFFHAHDGWDRASVIQPPAWFNRLRNRPPAAPPPAEEIGHSAQDIRAEVDRILDKINSHGFGSLTDAEKHLLDEAKDLLSKH